MNLENYHAEGYYDELFHNRGECRQHAERLVSKVKEQSMRQLRKRQKLADSIFLRSGITFNVYGDKKGTEKIFPFDLIPRIIPGSEWDGLELGLIQRIKALNAFLSDVYGARKILQAGLIPEFLVLKADCFQEACQGVEPANNIWINICGSDLVRDSEGAFFVLEDNLRTPSGVSYMIENRNVMKRTFPAAFHHTGVRPVEDYADHLRQMLLESSFRPASDSRVVVLTPGPFNSAYFEHAFLAQQMGVELVEPGDLIVDDDMVKMRSTSGFERIDVIYRRIDDEFIDPLTFRSDSLLGVPGIFNLFKRKKASLVNAPGTGVADDKAIYPYVPDMIRFYLQEEPILKNVPTFSCSDKKDLEFVLSEMAKLVVKATNLSGGYGMLIGDKADPREIDEFRNRIRSNPRHYIAQPILQLSTSPTLTNVGIEPRHVDLRPFVLAANSFYVTPGGLTRVALKKGSLVVNSSQGGGSKDTWVTK